MHSQPRFSFTSSTARPAASSAAMTSSFRLSMMPLAMKTAPSAIRPGTAGARDMMALATMLAVMMSYLPLALSDRSPTRTVSLSATPLRAAFSPAVRTATGSMSTPSATAAPSLRAAMARMPLPVPMSSTRSPPLTRSSSTSRQRLVVSWPPVPKARPGSRMSLTRSVS